MTQQFYSQVATQQKWKHTSTQTLVIKNIHGNTIHNSQKVETTQMPINTWKGEQNRVYPYDGILLSHKKEWGADSATTGMNLKTIMLKKREQTIMLSERSQTWKTTYCMIPLIQRDKRS